MRRSRHKYISNHYNLIIAKYEHTLYFINVFIAIFNNSLLVYLTAKHVTFKLLLLLFIIILLALTILYYS